MNAIVSSSEVNRIACRGNFSRGINFEALSLAMLVANDIIPFDRHHAYVRKQRHDGRWHYLTGFVPCDQLPSDSRIENYRRMYEQIVASQKRTFEVYDRKPKQYACYAHFELQSGVTGYLAIKRGHRFSTNEHEHLWLLARLVEGAHERKEVMGLLRRLHLNALDRRTLLQAATSKQILSEYLTKAKHLCHPEQRETGASVRPRKVKENVRATAKLLTPNGTTLQIVSSYSTNHCEWTPKNKATPYVLAHRDSIAARVFDAEETFWTNDYQHEKKAVVLFKDTVCHVSVPIVAGHMNCHGVFSIETTSSRAYNKYYAYAFSLLGAHAAWPLERALNRQYAAQQTHELRIVASIIESFQKAETRTHIIEAMKTGLQRLRFKRGLICEFKHHENKIIGLDSWGGTQIERVKEGTIRSFDTDKGDCQILCVQRRRSVLIRNPRADKRTHHDALERGNLKPYGIFPVFDNHGEVTMTVHVERADGVPLGSSDEALVTQVCTGATNAIEHVLHVDVGQDWIAEVITGQLLSSERLLRRFCQFVVENELVTRCRIFKVTEEGKQKGLCQAGSLLANKFEGFTLNKACGVNLSKLQGGPLLIRRASRQFHVQPPGEFQIVSVRKVEHEAKLRKEHSSEWIEAPVFENGKIVAKVVFDHANRTNDRFTLREMHLLATLCKTTSLANEGASSQELRSSLCRAGSVASLLRHRLSACVDSLLEYDGDYDDPAYAEHLEAAKHSLNRLQQLFSPYKALHATTVEKEVQEAAELIRPWRGSIRLDLPSPLPKAPLKESNYALCLIILILLENAIAAIQKLRTSGKGKFAISIDIAPVSDGKDLRISVTDVGVGVPDDVAVMFDFPPRLIGKRSRAHGKGLAYARALAEEMNWELQLANQSRPTTFDLILKDINLFEKGLQP